MKLNGIVGKGSGKLGASVFAISGGEQIVRQYNPQVSNPNTDAQVEQRAKLKLMSQLAAALSAGLAFKKKGLVSARNQFVSKNIGISTFATEKASVNLTLLQIAPGVKALPDLTTDAGQGGGHVVKLESPAASDVNRVVYVIFSIDAFNKLSIEEIKISNTPGAGRDFEVTTQLEFDDLYALAYGVEDANSAATAKYAAYAANASNNDASVLVDFLRNSADYGYSETKGIKIA